MQAKKILLEIAWIIKYFIREFAILWLKFVSIGINIIIFNSRQHQIKYKDFEENLKIKEFKNSSIMINLMKELLINKE